MSFRPARRVLWRHDPFAAEIAGGMLYGRGAADMKSAIAAFVGAVARHLAKDGTPKGSISLLITGDEEGPAVNGTVKVLDWLKQNGEVLDHCLVGEPTPAQRAGDTIKIGRRGSMNFRVIVEARQDMPPIRACAQSHTHHGRFRGPVSALTLDAGSEHFEPSTLAFTSRRCRQSRGQCHTGRSAGRLQHPLQRSAHARFADAKDWRPLRTQVRRDGRRNRTRKRRQRRIVS